MMRGVNAANERIKRRYFDQLREGDQLQPITIEHAARAIADYEEFTGWRNFKKFRRTDAAAYRKRLLEGPGKAAAQNSRSTVKSKLSCLHKFFRWLSRQPGFKMAVKLDDVDYFNLSPRDRRIALAPRERLSLSVEQLQHVVRSAPAANAIQLRDRALVACLMLTGGRITAVLSLKLKHVRADRQGVDFDSREVRTKFGKSFVANFLPVGRDILEVFLGYVDYLKSELLWGPDDPLFPKTKQGVRGAQKFETLGLERRAWKTPGSARDILKAACERAGVPYHSPHSVRTTLANFAERICTTPEEFKVFSQVLGHEDPLTTFRSYGHVRPQRQSQVIADLWARSERPEQPSPEEVLLKLSALLELKPAPETR